MKTYGKNFMVLMAVVLASVTSCVNDQLSEPLDDQLLREMPVLDEQLASVEASVKDAKALGEALASHDLEISGAIKAMESHIAALKKGMSLEKASIATLDLQKQVAGIVGEAEATLLTSGKMDNSMMRHILTFEAGVKAWLGESFSCYYPVAVAQAKVNTVVSSFDPAIKKQQLYVSALTSDVEAGLRKDEKPEELTSLAASVKETESTAQTLSEDIDAMAKEMEAGYRTALTTLLSSSAEFDADALTTLNSTASVASVDNSLEGLIARVEECESQLSSIISRLGALETTVGDLNELLTMIQSVAFMSDYAEDRATAYYTLNMEGTPDAEGRMPRTPDGSLELKYVVRPASAAAALTNQSIWNSDLKVMGYYAQEMTKAAGDFFNFTITNVTADQLTGVATVTVANSLSNAFYFKETGAKLALSVVTGKTDLTSKFVELAPKDKSGKVYVESLSITPESIEIEDNETAKITAKVLPADALVSALVYTSSNNDIATVSADGTVTAAAVGSATITVTTSGTDEWGRTLKATCAVTINSSIKIMGAGYVEEGGQTELRVDSPNYIDSQYVSWEIGTFSSKDANGVPVGFNTNQAFASIDDNGKVSGLLMYYNTADTAKEYVPLMVKCTIAGAIPVVLYHEMRVVAVQPLGISISNLSDTDTQVTTKVGQAVGLYGTIMPTTVNSEYFKVSYLGASDGYFAASYVGATTVTLSVQPGGSGKYNYFYPKGKGLSRNITVNVEPYYVKTVSLPATFEMNPDQSATLTPTFTSDVDGQAPTYQDLKWASSDPTIVSVNETTGEMTSLKEGTVTITATTSNANAVPSGQSQKSASCVVTVKTPVAPIAIGNYYYSDGTWGTDANPSGKSVIGVIFSTANAVASDPILLRDYPACTNGLVIALAEYESAFGNFRTDGLYSNSIYDATSGYGIAGYGAVLSETLPTGYGLTLAYANYRNNIKSSSGYENACILFDSETGVAAKHNNSVATPSTASTWFIPTKSDMNQLYENKSTINSSLSAAGGTQIGDSRYWSCYLYNKKLNGAGSYHDCYAYPIDMSTGSWINNAGNTTSYPVRVVLAF